MARCNASGSRASRSRSRRAAPRCRRTSSPNAAWACPGAHDVDLTLDDDQRLLADSARQLLERAYPSSAVRAAEEAPDGFSHDLWEQAIELGWPGIALPEVCGGAGYGLLELAIVAEELGRSAATLPLLPSYAAALPLLSAGSAAQQARWL